MEWFYDWQPLYATLEGWASALGAGYFANSSPNAEAAFRTFSCIIDPSFFSRLCDLFTTNFIENMRYKIFLIGFALIDLNINLLSLYNYTLLGLILKPFSIYLWPFLTPLKLFFANAILLLEALLTSYFFAYSYYSLFMLLLLFSFTACLTFCHILVLHYLKFLIINYNVIAILYKSAKYTIFSMLQALLNLYLYSLLFCVKIFAAKRFLKEARKATRKAKRKVKAYYLVV